MDMQEIVEKWLEDNGYDGLYNSGECGCLIGDLMPCDNPSPRCAPGFKVPGCSEQCGAGCDWHVNSSGDPKDEEA